MMDIQNTKSRMVKIEKDKIIYELNISLKNKEIFLNCRIDKPLKCYERKYSKTDLEEICKIFKDCDINEIYNSLLDSFEKNLFVFEINDENVIIKLNKINIFEYKELILPQKEIGNSEKIENLYKVQENLLEEINILKKDNENLKKEIKLIKEENENLKKNNNMKLIKEEVELIEVKLQNASNYGKGHNPFRVYKLKNGFVKLSGLINCTLGTTICQLPEKIRPKERLVFNCLKGGDTNVRVDVLSNGNVYVYGSGNDWVSLDNIFYFSKNI